MDQKQDIKFWESENILFYTKIKFHYIFMDD